MDCMQCIMVYKIWGYVHNTIAHSQNISNGDMRRECEFANGDSGAKHIYMNGDLRYTLFREVIMYG